MRSTRLLNPSTASVRHRLRAVAPLLRVLVAWCLFSTSARSHKPPPNPALERTSTGMAPRRSQVYLSPRGATPVAAAQLYVRLLREESMFRQLLILLHLLGAIVWIGGMFFAYFCLRPAAAQMLEPPKRLPLWASTFARFLPYAAIAVVVLLATGSAMLAEVGFRQAPVGWHLMLSLGLVMAAVFAYVYFVLYPKLRTSCAASDWPAAAQVLNRIRRLVALNLVLGICTVVAAISAR